MKKHRICIEHELHSRSSAIIWNLISTAEGLSLWVADEVHLSDDTLTFIWGELWRNHEIKEAKILEKIKNSYIRFKWKDDDDESSYTEIRMVRNDVTNDYILVITDFTDDDDHEQLEAIWSDNLVRLHHSSGLWKEWKKYN